MLILFPLADKCSRSIGEASNNDHDEIHQGAEAQQASSEEIEDSGPGLPYIEAVDSQIAYKQAQEQCDKS